MQTNYQWGDIGSDERTLALALGSLNSWGLRRFLKFFDYWSGDLRAWFLGDDPFRGLMERRGKRIQAELVNLHQGGVERALDDVGKWPGSASLIGEPGYPAVLQELDEPPAVLHVQGNAALLNEPILAVVGSRKISGIAGRAARDILMGAHRERVCLLSGGALGADTVAHRSSLDASRPGLVVLPSGLGRYTPRSNQGLFREMLDIGGVLVSEYHPNSEVRKFHFRRRNEVIAALSKGVFVLRAAEKSGTMLTVEAARRMGRALGAMPGDPDNPLAFGCHQILRDGGAYISSEDDLRVWLRDLGSGEATRRGGQLEIGLLQGQKERRSDEGLSGGSERELPECAVLAQALELQRDVGSFSIEELVRATEQSAAELQGLLLGHELSGYVVRCGGERFRVC